MCLCTQLTNRVNLVCVKCKTHTKDFRSPTEQFNLCPVCREKMIDIGSKVEVPKKRDKKGWERLAKLIATTKYFSVCQCGC
jgi:hypothetical protein